MSWCPACCDCCRYERGDHEHKGRYDGVEYQKLCSGPQKEDSAGAHDQIDVVLPRYENVPLTKIFEFQQLQRPAVHPQMFFSAETKPAPITQQPSFTGLDSGFVIQDDEPRIQFSLYYDMQRYCLTIHLISATSLTDRNKKRKTELSPYVLVFLIPSREQIFESKLKRDTNNPIFKETFEFTGLPPDEVRRQTLILRVLNKARSAFDIGIVTLPLENVDLYGVNMNVKLAKESCLLNQSDCNGDILISLMHDGSADTITGLILKATNLLGMDIGGLSDPYVSVHLYNNGKREYKWKSSIKHKTLFPVYNESFHFDIRGMNIESLQLEIRVKDHDRVGQNDMIGVVMLGKESDHHTGRTHWMEMISSPCNQITFWHSIEKASNYSTLKRLSLQKSSNVHVLPPLNKAKTFT